MKIRKFVLAVALSSLALGLYAAVPPTIGNIPLSEGGVSYIADYDFESMIDTDGKGTIIGIGPEASGFSNISIPSSVKGEKIVKIGDRAFYYLSDLKSVSIEDGIEEIGDEAFRSCHALKSVRLPSTLKSIGKGAFQGDRLLKSIVIPPMVNAIKENTFKDCLSLESVEFSSSVQSIGKNAFASCKMLKEIDLRGVRYISNGAFEKTEGLKSITVSSSLLSSAPDAFKESGLSEVNYQGKYKTFKETLYNFFRGYSVVVNAEDDSKFI